MKLELKHLAPYLPYGVHLMNKYGRYHNTTLNKSISIYEMLEMKLILRPLSDLTKEIEHNGEVFVPLYALIAEDKAFTMDFIETFGYEELKVCVYEKLLEWHVDIFGLIDKGLAVDINEIKNL